MSSRYVCIRSSFGHCLCFNPSNMASSLSLRNCFRRSRFYSHITIEIFIQLIQHGWSCAFSTRHFTRLFSLSTRHYSICSSPYLCSYSLVSSACLHNSNVLVIAFVSVRNHLYLYVSLISVIPWYEYSRDSIPIRSTLSHASKNSFVHQQLMIHIHQLLARFVFYLDLTRRDHLLRHSPPRRCFPWISSFQFLPTLNFSSLAFSIVMTSLLPVIF